ncbi:MAG TPA: hypothetical protein VGC91_11465 [Pyrinomonadaceae bacterium]
MKKLLSCLAISLFAFVLLLPSQAQGAAAHRAVVQDDKNALYEKFHKNITGDINMQRIAYAAGKEYLEKYPKDADAKAKEIKEWIARFETQLPVEVQIKVYKEKNYAAAFELGKQALTNSPDNLSILIALGYAGMQASASGNTDFIGDANTSAKKAIELIEAGKAPASWKPFVNKDDTLGWLNYSLGMMAYRSAPTEAVTYLTKAAQYEGAPKRNPVLYFYLATLYNDEYKKQSDSYTAKYSGKQATPESKAELEKIDALLDPVIDSFARAVAYANADAQSQTMFQQQKTDWMNELTKRYKHRHNDSDAGLKELVDTVRTKPLPGQQGLTPMSMP